MVGFEITKNTEGYKSDVEIVNNEILVLKYLLTVLEKEELYKACYNVVVSILNSNLYEEYMEVKYESAG